METKRRVLMEQSKNLPLLLGVCKGTDLVIEEILSGKIGLADTLIKLGMICKVRIKFKQPVEIVENRMRVMYKEYTFSGFFMCGNSLCYVHRRRGRRGYYMPALDLIESYEPVITSVNIFTSYESFKARFDTFFITESEIQKLWDGKSSQTGEKYCPGDFKSLGKVGRLCMARFLRSFKGVTSDSVEGYMTNSYGITLRVNHDTYRHTGRDITISHTKGLGYVHYSSEFMDCGNGRYGLIVNRNNYLHLEDD
jgi:hypothetical protein